MPVHVDALRNRPSPTAGTFVGKMHLRPVRRHFMIHHMERTPASLLDRLRQPGAASDWHRFVDLYTPLLLRWVRRWFADESDVNDLVQDIFTVLVQKLPSFEYRPNRSFRAWLYTVTANKCRDERGRRAVSARPMQPGQLEAVPDPDEDDGEAEYRRVLLQRALVVLQPEFEPATWAAFQQTSFSDKSAAEVAADLQTTPGAVRAAKFRVLHRLRQELRGLLD